MNWSQNYINTLVKDHTHIKTSKQKKKHTKQQHKNRTLKLYTLNTNDHDSKIHTIIAHIHHNEEHNDHVLEPFST